MGLYNENFHKRRVGRSYYHEIANATHSIFKYSELSKTKQGYESILDIGCSCGALLACFNYPVKHGIDHDILTNTFLTEAGIYHECDLSQTHLNLGIGFDLITCLEVAEHLPSTSSQIFDTMVANANIGSTLIFSGARVGQRGRHHINCKDSWQWLEILTKIGYNYSAPMTNNFMSEVGSKLPDCYRSNIMILNRSK